MPTYGYRCQSCEAEFELLQRMSDPPVAACPTCGGAGRRLFYPAGILFKGSGFYKTDSRGAETAPNNGSAAADAPTKPGKPATGDSPAASPEKAGTTDKSDKSDKKAAAPASSPAPSPPSTSSPSSSRSSSPPSSSPSGG